MILEDNNMASTTVLIFIGILVASLVFGIGLFYGSHTGSKRIKKQQIDVILSYSVQFVIYIWLGKMIASFPRILHDPIAVLASPADSTAFYIATFFILFHLFIQQKRRKMNDELLIKGFVPVFFATSFFNGFLQITINQDEMNLYFVWVMVLSIVSIWILQKPVTWLQSSILMMIWAVGACIISLQKGYIVMFGFLLQPIYFIGIFLFFSGYTWLKMNKNNITKQVDE